MITLNRIRIPIVLIFFIFSIRSSFGVEEDSINSSSSTNTTKCRDGECDNGECMKGRVACDGKKDCSDGSDETVKLCASIYCPPQAFRCDYGACIGREALCNGVVDCVDGSDETSDLCGKRNSTTSNPIPNGCKIDYVPDLGIKNGNGGDENQLDIIPGQYVEEYTLISYSCRPNYLLQGVTENICVNGKFYKSHPICLKYCPNHNLIGNSFQSLCQLNGTMVSCLNPILPGTKVTLACQFGYKKPASNVHDVINCDESGSWDNIPYSCIQMCGEVHPDIIPFISGGLQSNITKAPWHVGIYKTRNDISDYICGGTIISAKLVISAAHCFWNEQENEALNQNLFKVAAGKYYQKFDAEEPLSIQVSDINKIHISEIFQGSRSSYTSDIAVVVLTNTLRYSFYIKPACLQWQTYSQKSMPSNKKGSVAGWGITLSGKPSPELHSAELETLSFEDCQQKIDNQFKHSITGDKFCVSSNSSGANVCRGDTGGGFLIPKNDNGGKRYYLEGIASGGIRNDGGGDFDDCSSNFFATFTNVQFYREMIQTYLDMYQVK